MAQRSLPWNGTALGDCGPYSDAEWAEAWRYIIGLANHRANASVLLGSGDSGIDGLKVRATGPASANVEVTAGAATVHGTMFLNDATVTLAIAANGSGNPRIDTIILRKDFSAQTIRAAVKQGTPAASPTPPSLTQTAGVLWEIPLADIAVANGFVSIANADITPRVEYANAADGVYLDMVLNNSGGELNTGDVVIWDTTTNRAVTTTTTQNAPNTAGVWVGRTANGGYGRLLVRGIGLVRTNAAISTRFTKLATSTSAKQAAVFTDNGDAFEIGFSLETTGAAGLVLAYVDVRRRVQDYILIRDEKAQNTAGGSFNSGAWQKRDLNTIVVDTGGHASIASSVITLQPGTYRVHIQCPALDVQAHQARLQNTSDGTTTLLGNSAFDRATGGTNCSIIIGRFTITAAKNFEVQHQCNTTKATNGFGLAANFATEIYTIVELIRER